METLSQILADRIKAQPFNLVATIIFFLAILHTFLASKFLRLSHKYQQEHEGRLARHGKTGTTRGSRDEVSFRAEVFHFLGDVEAMFGIWMIPLVIEMTI